jgi:hypothetical protein
MIARSPDQIALLSALFARPQREVQAPAAAMLGLRRIDGRVEVEVEVAGGRSERFRVTDASDARLAGLRDVDRRRVALALTEVQR